MVWGVTRPPGGTAGSLGAASPPGFISKAPIRGAGLCLENCDLPYTGPACRRPVTGHSSSASTISTPGRCRGPRGGAVFHPVCAAVKSSWGEGWGHLCSGTPHWLNPHLQQGCPWGEAQEQASRCCHTRVPPPPPALRTLSLSLA